MHDSGFKAIAWQMRDENMYAFIERKYHDRQALSDQAEAARKLAEKSQTIEGNPNPQYPRLLIEADIAQMKLEMAYVLDKNAQLAQYIDTLEFLHQRVGVLEGAYAHIKMLAETCRIDYALISKAVEFVKKFKQEHSDDKEKPTKSG